ncbi:hypothetical protein WMF37_31905 [Sorangium sp. So ce291]|uniref:hypothetical protein n=1 Tax=Sorangium sp. So ce291 TaxID=3133294 RepID=UPI003F6304F2
MLPPRPMKPRDIVVATHGHCFDGMASAALFTRLMQALRPGEPLAFRYRSCGYGPGMTMIPPSWLDGDENAILDFRYTPTKKLTWYFDHHITGFGSDDERDAALAGATQSRAAGDAPHVFYDAAYGSCTKLIADVGRDHFSVEMSGVDELIRWADVIDTARFPSAEAAVSREEPIMQLASVVEHHGDGPFLASVVPRLVEQPVSEVARAPDIQELWRPLSLSRQTFVARIERGARKLGRVVLVDLSDAPLEAVGKFMTYAMYPECVYSVTLSRHKQHYKLSVGYNPWCGVARDRDIAPICRRYDGGGHPAVGAASFPLSALERAREAARTVAEELNEEPER